MAKRRKKRGRPPGGVKRYSVLVSRGRPWFETEEGAIKWASGIRRNLQRRAFGNPGSEPPETIYIVTAIKVLGKPAPLPPAPTRLPTAEDFPAPPAWAEQFEASANR